MSETAGGTVFHVASYGMSGKQMMQTELTEAVNVGGTKNVIEGTARCVRAVAESLLTFPL